MHICPVVVSQHVLCVELDCNKEVELLIWKQILYDVAVQLNMDFVSRKARASDPPV